MEVDTSRWKTKLSRPIPTIAPSVARDCDIIGDSRRYLPEPMKRSPSPIDLPTEIFLTHPRRSLGKIVLDWMPQPGHHLNLEGQTYAILERHHHYQYRHGGYQLDRISLYVQRTQKNTEKSYVDGRWVIGDASCLYNARSEILRCAVNPEGSCNGCRYYQAIASDNPTDS